MRSVKFSSLLKTCQEVSTHPLEFYRDAEQAYSYPSGNCLSNIKIHGKVKKKSSKKNLLARDEGSGSISPDLIHGFPDGFPVGNSFGRPAQTDHYIDLCASRQPQRFLDAFLTEPT